MATVLENLKNTLLNIFEINQKLVKNQVKYLDTSDTEITLTGKTYLKNNYPITTLNLTINVNSNNSCLLFTTGDTFDYTFLVDPSFKINKQFNFEPNKTYLISVDNYVILWSELYGYDSDLISLGILSKPISEFTNDDIGTTVSIPYTDASGKILLNENGCIEFEVVGVNHHTSEEYQQTITLMTKNVIRGAVFDVEEPNNPLYDGDYMIDARAQYGNNRWLVSNIRQWLNSSGAANSWFTKQHEFDEAPTIDNVNHEAAAYASDPGFLAGFSPEVLQYFTDITNTTALPWGEDESGSETTIDKVFLPSYTEMGFGNNGEIAEGTHLSVRYPTEDNNSRIKSGASDSYWMRSPITYDSVRVKVVPDTGTGTDKSSDGPAAAGPNSVDVGIVPIIVLHEKKLI